MTRRNGRYHAKCKCEKCSHEWTLLVDCEYGTTNLINDDDMECPECGLEAEKIDIGGLL